MFDSPHELVDKIRLGEDSLLELKVIRFSGERILGPGRNDLADELAAFANGRGGVLVLGVDGETREVEGIPLDRLDRVEAYLHEILNDSIEPPLPATIVRLELPDSTGTPRPVLKVEIERSLFVHRSPGGYFHRIGSSKRQIRPDLLARLFRQRSHAGLIQFDEEPVPGATFDSLSGPLWTRFLGTSGEDSALQLEKRGILVRDDAGVLRPSVAGVLMTAEDPSQFLPSAYIEAVSYRGVERDSNYQLDAARIRGPLDEQIRQAMVFLRKNQRVSAIKDPHRIEKPQFSERAVFEAIVNAVAHRDYSIHASKIRFFLFGDRLELYSPGALANTVTVETIALRQATRNELVCRLLSECPVPASAGDVGREYFMERRGEGVPLLLRESERLSGRRPEYHLIDEAELVLTIFAAPPPSPRVDGSPSGEGER